jgi:molybdate transport system substrate-binding protein
MVAGPWARVAALLAAIGALASPVDAQGPRRLAVAAAADLQAVLPDIVRDFERSAGASVVVSYGSSGTFFAQIRNGAPFDVFLSADVDYPRQLTTARLADPATLQVYARGHLALWTRRETRLDIGRGLHALTDARVRHVAVANPSFAPYGRAAVAALRSARLYDTVQPKLVMGDNIAQAAQLVESGNADAGILSLSLVLGQRLRAQGTYVEIPESNHPPIDQGAVVVSTSREPALARRFIDHLRAPQTAIRLERFGFTVPAVR